MMKKLFLFVIALVLSGLAMAVEVNKASQAELDSVKGIGPAISKRIVDERSKNGPFKDWADFENRVKGVGDKTAAKMSESGLTVNGKAMQGAAAAGAPGTAGKAKSSSASDDAKSKKPAEARPAASSGKADKPADKAADKAADKKASDKKDTSPK